MHRDKRYKLFDRRPRPPQAVIHLARDIARHMKNGSWPPRCPSFSQFIGSWQFRPSMDGMW